MNQEKRTRKRLTKIDYFLILTVFLLTIAGIWLRYRGKNADPEDLRIEYTVLLENVPIHTDTERQVWEIIAVGDEVYNENGTTLLGTVISCTPTAHRTPVLRDGEILLLETPSKTDVLIDVRGSGRFREGDGIRINDIRIAAGMTGNFRIGNYYAKGVGILSVEEMKSE